MKIALRKFAWTSTGFALALMAGSPAVADDTELLLINPDPSKSPKANVMFILDTSFSMTTTQSTVAPYDSNTTYDGDCRSDAVYFTDIDATPDCDGTETNWVYTTAFQCDFARSLIAGVGSYTNTMVQYRDGGKLGGGTGNAKWQYLANGYHNSPVECESDSGVHGDGRSTHRWASKGTDLADPWTNSAQNELSWGSAPRNIGYTFYSGNYLNWQASPANVTISRTAIMKEVTKKVLNSVSNLNVGIMRFNGNNGGAIIQDIVDLDTNRQDIIDAVDALPATGNTPLAETLYEAALYWRGQEADYGSPDNTSLSDSGVFVSGSDPETYEQPTWDACAKNYNVLLSDGEPRQDEDVPGKISNLPGWAETLGQTGCTVSSGNGACLEDVAEYLYLKDADANEDEDQIVTTHTIGFTINLPVLKATAQKSGGQYFLADDVQSLTKTLLSIIANINDRSLSFSAPAVSVNTFNRTQNLNDLYITMFGATNRVHWPGNLKKYRIADGKVVDANSNPAVDATTGFFDENADSYWTVNGPDGNDVLKGGAALMLPTQATRKLYTNIAGTNLTADGNQISIANAAAFEPIDFGLTGADGEPTKNDVINWMRGEDVLDVDNDDTTTTRFRMGDPLHAQPAAVVYGGTPADPETVVYVATNDGYLHAIDGKTGVELWSFVPEQLLSNMKRLMVDPDSKYKQYGIDGNVVPVVKDVNNNGIIEAGTDFVYIIFGMRRGGSTYFAMDVTNKNAPKILWTINEPTMGDSWSTPVVAKIDIKDATQNADKAVVVLAGGYDTVHDTDTHPVATDAEGNGVYFFDLVSGARLWRAGVDVGADRTIAKMTRAMPNAMRVLDLNGDGLADRMYGSDLGGQVWRFDIYNGETVDKLVTGGVIARLGAEGVATPTDAQTRRFYVAPDIAFVTDQSTQRRFLAINIGTGYRAHPFDLKAADRFYSVRDGAVFAQLTQTDYDNYPIIKESDLVEVAGKKGAVVTQAKRGWMFTLPNNQKVLSESLTFDDEVFFVSFTPDEDTERTCATGKGTNYLYRMSIFNGDPIVPNLETLTDAQADNARNQALQQGGIAPSPTILFPSPTDANCTGDECSPPPLGCVGVECFDPGFENYPVRTLWTQDGIE